MIKIAKIAVLAGFLLIVAMLPWILIAFRGTARDEPGAIESFAARGVRNLAIPSASRKMMNPVAAAKDVLPEAMAHFADHCAFCHANDGSGDTPIGKGLYPKPPDMRQVATQDLTDGELFYIIHNGVRLTGMPAFGDASAGGQDLDSWKLVHFIRHLPKITMEELEQMKKMNPKSPDELKEEEALQKFLEGDDTPLPSPAHKHE